MILHRRSKYLTVYKLVDLGARRLPGGLNARGVHKNLQNSLCFGLIIEFTPPVWQ